MTDMVADHLCDRYLAALEGLRPERLDSLAPLVADDVRFADPFQDVRGWPAYRAVFAHMFAVVADLRFVVSDRAINAAGTIAYARWRLEGRIGARPWVVDGVSEIHMRDGRIATHIDHWDAARGFYEQMPVIGGLLRVIRRRIASAGRPGS